MLYGAWRPAGANQEEVVRSIVQFEFIGSPNFHSIQYRGKSNYILIFLDYFGICEKEIITH